MMQNEPKNQDQAEGFSSVKIEDNLLLLQTETVNLKYDTVSAFFKWHNH